MLNHQLNQAQKEILRLRAQLAHRPGTSANPAILCTATAVRRRILPKIFGTQSYLQCPEMLGRLKQDQPTEIIMEGWLVYIQVQPD